MPLTLPGPDARMLPGPTRAASHRSITRSRSTPAAVTGDGDDAAGVIVACVEGRASLGREIRMTRAGPHLGPFRLPRPSARSAGEVSPRLIVRVPSRWVAGIATPDGAPGVADARVEVRSPLIGSLVSHASRPGAVTPASTSSHVSASADPLDVHVEGRSPVGLGSQPNHFQAVTLASPAASQHRYELGHVSAASPKAILARPRSTPAAVTGNGDDAAGVIGACVELPLDQVSSTRAAVRTSSHSMLTPIVAPQPARETRHSDRGPTSGTPRDDVFTDGPFERLSLGPGSRTGRVLAGMLAGGDGADGASTHPELPGNLPLRKPFRQQASDLTNHRRAQHSPPSSVPAPRQDTPSADAKTRRDLRPAAVAGAKPSSPRHGRRGSIDRGSQSVHFQVTLPVAARSRGRRSIGHVTQARAVTSPPPGRSRFRRRPARLRQIAGPLQPRRQRRCGPATSVGISQEIETSPDRWRVARADRPTAPASVAPGQPVSTPRSSPQASMRPGGRPKKRFQSVSGGLLFSRGFQTPRADRGGRFAHASPGLPTVERPSTPPAVVDADPPSTLPAVLATIDTSGVARGHQLCRCFCFNLSTFTRGLPYV